MAKKRPKYLDYCHCCLCGGEPIVKEQDWCIWCGAGGTIQRMRQDGNLEKIKVEAAALLRRYGHKMKPWEIITHGSVRMIGFPPDHDPDIDALSAHCESCDVRCDINSSNDHDASVPKYMLWMECRSPAEMQVRGDLVVMTFETKTDQFICDKFKAMI